MHHATRCGRIAGARAPAGNAKPQLLAVSEAAALLLPSQPIVDVKTATNLLGGSAERSRQAIARLEQAGVLRQTSVGKRNRAWECVGLFDLLDRFESDLGPTDRTPRQTEA